MAINAAHAEVASVYGGSDGRCGSRTANGERVNCSAMTAAHRNLPFGSVVTVCHRGCVVVRINDRGPFVRGRHIDLTPVSQLGLRLSLRRRAPARAREIIEEFPSTADLRPDSQGRSERLMCPTTTARTIVSMLARIGARPSGADVELPTGEVKGFLVMHAPRSV